MQVRNLEEVHGNLLLDFVSCTNFKCISIHDSDTLQWFFLRAELYCVCIMMYTGCNMPDRSEVRSNEG